MAPSKTIRFAGVGRGFGHIEFHARHLADLPPKNSARENWSSLASIARIWTTLGPVVLQYRCGQCLGLCQDSRNREKYLFVESDLDGQRTGSLQTESPDRGSLPTLRRSAKIEDVSCAHMLPLSDSLLAVTGLRAVWKECLSY